MQVSRACNVAFRRDGSLNRVSGEVNRQVVSSLHKEPAVMSEPAAVKENDDWVPGELPPTEKWDDTCPGIRFFFLYH